MAPTTAQSPQPDGRSRGAPDTGGAGRFEVSTITCYGASAATTSSGPSSEMDSAAKACAYANSSC
jgi:hypothetical protein